MKKIQMRFQLIVDIFMYSVFVVLLLLLLHISPIRATVELCANAIWRCTSF